MGFVPYVGMAFGWSLQPLELIRANVSLLSGWLAGAPSRISWQSVLVSFWSAVEDRPTPKSPIAWGLQNRRLENGASGSALTGWPD